MMENMKDQGMPMVMHCVEINFTESFLGDGAAVLARSSGEELASPRHRAGVIQHERAVKF